MAVRVAVVGAGIMGADHAAIIASDIPGAVLQVVCDANAARAKTVADACGAAHVETDPFAAIARADIDAVLVASTDDTHAPLAVAAIAAGKPVLCEKPLAPTSAAGRPVIEAEVKAGRRLVQLGFMRRFDPSYAEMRAVALSGVLGRPMMMHNLHRNVSTPGDWFTGEMAITNSASHEFDIARFVLDTDYAAISVFSPTNRSGGLAPVFMVIETVGGQVVDIEINNNAAYGYDVRGELVCETGSVLLNAGPPTLTYADLKSFERFAADWRKRFAEAYRLQNRAWIASIESGVPNAVAASAFDGYCAALAGEAGVEALATGRRIAIPQPDRPALYRSS